MERYSEYKDSGVQWLGEIPSHWKVAKLKFYSDIIMGQSPLGNDVVDFGKIQFMQGNAEFGVKYPSPRNYCDKAKKYSRIGDILMSVRAPVGALNVSDKVYGIGRGLCAIKPVNVSLLYLWYYLQYGVCGFKQKATGSTFESVNMDTIKGLNILLPTSAEQDAIVRYLDAATSKIDKAIAMQQKMIDLLNERKQIIIQNAVTKGLDDKVELKDSGVEWIGMIPKHWSVRRGKYLFRIINEYSTTGNEELLTVSDRTGITPRSLKNVNMFMAESLIGYKKCSKGDICSNIMWMWHGAVGVTEYNGVISPSYGVYRQIREEYDSYYLDYLLRVPKLVEVYKLNSTGLTESRLRLYPDDFFNINFILPPIKEQRDIVSLIKKQVFSIDKNIEHCQRQITLLQERKQIIINEVVTGKVKVS